MKPIPFRIDIPQADLDDLARRLRGVRWAADFGNEDWRYGVERGWLEEMVEYWHRGFDWRAQEARMNAWRNGSLTAPASQHSYSKGFGLGVAPVDAGRIGISNLG